MSAPATSAQKNYDLVVIGSGPGGYVGAIRAAHNGLRVAIVEKDPRLGGTCLLRGCIPTKSLLHSADVLDTLERAAEFGIIAGDVAFDFAKVQKNRAKVVTRSAAGVAYLMKSNGIDVHKGSGSLIDRNTVRVTGGDTVTDLGTKWILIATGAVPTELPSTPIDGERFITSDHALTLAAVPASMLILGAGAVGLEMASVYARFGTRCTVVEMLDRPLPYEDREVCAELGAAFKTRGIEILTETKLETAEIKGGEVVATLANAAGTTSRAAQVCLVAVGRRPVTRGLGLNAVGVEIDQRGFIPVDGKLRTAVDNIYAVGDVVPTPALAHVASAEALVAVDEMCGKDPAPLAYDQTPACLFADPEVASVGLNEAMAQERGYNVKVGKFPFAASGKARIMGKTRGFAKIVSDAQYDEVLGVQIIGPRATDLIAEACVVLRTGCTTEELARTIHAHPTLPEVVMEAAHAALGRALHL